MDSDLSGIQIFLMVIIPTIISSIPPIISAIAAKKSKAKEKADIKEQDASAADKISMAYDKVVEDMQIRIDKMEERQKKKEADDEIKQKLWDERFEQQNKRIFHLEQGVYKLIRQVRSLGAEPVFTLEEPKEQ